ncbi:MAG TPA: DEAD/DEAH box helicase, partial [Longimicrobiaceae bacterium]|nr:DEAD/DEAH box helicase [Longimicrobiaceae bacterium]
MPASSFNELGLREPLLAALEEAGIERPTALQAAAIPVLRREGNFVARASSGSGKTLAYALGVLDRLEPREPAEADEPDEDEDEDGDEEKPAAEAAAGGVRLLVLAATPEQAERAALGIAPFVQAAGLTVTASRRGWGATPADADVLVATPSEVLDAVRTSGVKLDALEAVVVDGASDIEALGGWEALETLFDNAPRTAQRVLVTAETTSAVDDLVDRRVRRALRWPPQAAVPAAEEEPTGVVGYVLVSEREKADVVARLIGGERGGDAAPLLVCRTEERAAGVAETLAVRGFLVGEIDDPDVDVAIAGGLSSLDQLGEEAGEHPGTVISYDVPPDEETLRGRHGGEITGFVLCQPRELRHLREIARRAGLDPRPAGITGEDADRGSDVRAFRALLRRALRDEDLGAQMLVL